MYPGPPKRYKAKRKRTVSQRPHSAALETAWEWKAGVFCKGWMLSLPSVIATFQLLISTP